MTKTTQGAVGIPFAIRQGSDRDLMIREAINYRKSGGKFISADKSLANMREALSIGAKNESK